VMAVFRGDLISLLLRCGRMVGDSTIDDLDDGRIGFRAGVQSADGTICRSCFRLIGTPLSSRPLSAGVRSLLQTWKLNTARTTTPRVR
jgi:hypothetical protein